MSLVALGINHKSASISLRERIVFAPERLSEALQDICKAAKLDQVVILSTCNRTEIIAICPQHVQKQQPAKDERPDDIQPDGHIYLDTQYIPKIAE